MKSSFLKPVIVGTIVFLLIAFLMRSHYSTRSAKHNLEDLKSEVDSLRSVAESYTILRSKYDSLYANLDGTRLKMVELQNKINGLTENQVLNLKTIKSELHSIVDDLDSINAIPLAKSSDLDSLKF